MIPEHTTLNPYCASEPGILSGRCGGLGYKAEFGGYEVSGFALLLCSLRQNIEICATPTT